MELIAYIKSLKTKQAQLTEQLQRINEELAAVRSELGVAVPRVAADRANGQRKTPREIPLTGLTVERMLTALAERPMTVKELNSSINTTTAGIYAPRLVDAGKIVCSGGRPYRYALTQEQFAQAHDASNGSSPEPG